MGDFIRRMLAWFDAVSPVYGPTPNDLVAIKKWLEDGCTGEMPMPTRSVLPHPPSEIITIKNPGIFRELPAPPMGTQFTINELLVDAVRQIIKAENERVERVIDEAMEVNCGVTVTRGVDQRLVSVEIDADVPFGEIHVKQKEGC